MLGDFRGSLTTSLKKSNLLSNGKTPLVDNLDFPSAVMFGEWPIYDSTSQTNDLDLVHVSTNQVH